MMKEGIKGFSVYLPGAILVVLGALVILFPMLLVGLFSAGLIVLGITAISVAYRLRKWQRNSHWTVAWEPIDPHGGDWLQRVFVYRRW